MKEIGIILIKLQKILYIGLVIGLINLLQISVRFLAYCIMLTNQGLIKKNYARIFIQSTKHFWEREIRMVFCQVLDTLLLPFQDFLVIWLKKWVQVIIMV